MRSWPTQSSGLQRSELKFNFCLLGMMLMMPPPSDNSAESCFYHVEKTAIIPRRTLASTSRSSSNHGEFSQGSQDILPPDGG